MLNIVQDIDNRVALRRALISVSDKTGLDAFVPALLESCPELVILSTGGTYAAIKALLKPGQEDRLQAVSDYTGQPEMQGGLVKTLDFKIYMGLLSETYNDAHGVTPEQARTNIDIGGPCMVRASAKNYLRVASVTDPADYPRLAKELAEHNGTLGLDTRFYLMKKAFAHTADYDTAIASFFAKTAPEGVNATYRLH